MRIPLEYLGRPLLDEGGRPFAKFKKINVILLNNLREKKVLKRCAIWMPYKAGNYDYCKDLQELFIKSLTIRSFVSRETLKKSKTFVYRVYLSK